MKNAEYVQIVALCLVVIGSLFFISGSFIQQSPQTAAVAGSGSGLVAYYTFDDGSGTTASDGAGTYSGTLSGPTWTTGKIGQALSFAGPADHVDTASITGNASNYSVAGWFKTTNTSGSNTIISWGTMGCRFNYSAPGILNCYVNNSSSGSAKTTVSVADGNWHHFVFANSGSTQTLYIDGAQAGTASQTGGSISGGVRFGLFWGSTSGGFVGTLDEMRIYDHALVQTEVSELYAVTTSQATTQTGGGSGGTTTPPPTSEPPTTPTNPGTLPVGPLTQWKFDEGSGTTVSDASGNGLTGTFTGFPQWSTGVSGSALRFDGATTYVNGTPSSALLSGTTGNAAFSISAWIKPDVFSSSAINGRQIVGLGTSVQYGGWNVVYEPTHYSTPEGAKFDLTSGHIRFYYADSSVDKSITNNATELAVNTWHHIVATYDQPNHTSKIYVDGVLKTSLGNLSGSLMSPTVQNFTVGSNKSNVAGGTFNGSIDDVQVYGKVLSDSEIQSLFATGLSSIPGDDLPPNVTVTAPSQYATVSGSITLSASASDNSGVAGVQFKVDGQNVGSEITSAPYTMQWNSATVSNGGHSISVRVRDTAGNQTASAWTSVTVNNTVTQAPSGSVTPTNGIYTVDSAGGTNVFTTIQSCADVVKAGETCLVSAGTYPEHVVVKNGGSDASRRVTFKANGAVFMRGFEISKPYVTVDGFDITGSLDYWNSTRTQQYKYEAYVTMFTGGNYCEVLNNNIHDGITLAYGIHFRMVSGLTANNCVVRGNSLDHLNYQYISIAGNNHLIESNTLQNLDGWDAFRAFGHDNTIRRNVLRFGVERAGIGNHPDVIQTFPDDGGEAYNYLFEENWIENINTAIGQMNSGSAVTGNGPNFHDFAFRKNVFITVASNMSIDIPGLVWDHNTFYHTPYLQSGLLYGGSLTRGDASYGRVMNNAFIDGGSAPTVGGFYSMGGAALIREVLGLGIKDSTALEGIYTDLKNNLYIAQSGGEILPRARTLTSINDFVLNSAYAGYKQFVYDKLMATVALDTKMRTTFVADYNFATPLKKVWSEVHGITTSNSPQLSNPSDPDGPDNTPFTLDDGLKPVSGSPLCGKGEGGTDIGAYSCSPSTVFAIAGSGVSFTQPPPPVVTVVGDFNRDGVVNSIDLSLMAGAWNTTNSTYDLNRDGRVNTLDYSIMVRNWTT